MNIKKTELTVTDQEKLLVQSAWDCVQPFEVRDIVAQQEETIKRQKAEIESLIAGQETLQKYIAEKDAEIERLKELLDDEEKKFKLCAKRYYEIGVKEFVERLEPLKRLRSLLYESDYELSVTMRQVDKVKKEMVGES